MCFSIAKQETHCRIYANACKRKIYAYFCKFFYYIFSFVAIKQSVTESSTVLNRLKCIRNQAIHILRGRYLNDELLVNIPTMRRRCASNITNKHITRDFKQLQQTHTNLSFRIVCIIISLVAFGFCFFFHSNRHDIALSNLTEKKPLISTSTVWVIEKFVYIQHLNLYNQ